MHTYAHTYTLAVVGHATWQMLVLFVIIFGLGDVCHPGVDNDTCLEVISKCLYPCIRVCVCVCTC